MNQRPYFIVNVETLVRRSGRYLLIQRSQKEEHSPGTISLVGGKLDYEVVSPDAFESTLR